MTSQEHLYVRATTLAEAWNRFKPDLPLPHDSPFYVTRALYSVRDNCDFTSSNGFCG